MKKQELQSIIYAMELSLSLLLEEYETLQDDEMRQKYDEAIGKLREAIKITKTYD